MNDLPVDDEFAWNQRERLWFGALAAARAAQLECDVLREVMVLSQAAWNRSRERLAELQALRDAFGEKTAA
jgi:hypothetical protein